MANGIRTALITGGAGDIGKALARRLLTNGSRVAIMRTELTRPWRGRSTSWRVSARSVALRPTSPTSPPSSSTWRGFGGSSGRSTPSSTTLVSRATRHPSSSTRTNTFRRVLAVNVEGVFLGLKHVLPGMMARGSGAVVNSASVSGLRGAELLSGYSASKHAVIGLTRTAALEAGPAGVRVNAVCPSAVGGRMIQVHRRAECTGRCGTDHSSIRGTQSPWTDGLHGGDRDRRGVPCSRPARQRRRLGDRWRP